jgi:serine/threonine protein phosphatase PrpC
MSPFRPGGRRQRREAQGEPEQREPQAPRERPPVDPSEAETLTEADTAAQRPAPAPSGPSPPTPEPRKPALPQDTPALPDPPVIGRIASSWRRRLAQAEWPHPGYVADGGELGDFELLAASVVGQGHLHRASQRQDAYRFAATADGVALAVADGVSAKPLAAIGAETAAFAAVQVYRELAEEAAAAPELAAAEGSERLRLAVGAADRAVRETAARLKLEPRELSTTLLLAHLRRGEQGAMVVETASIGNSSALALRGEEPPAILSGPGPEDRSAYADFLPGEPHVVRVDGATLQPEATLVLATDGLAEDLHLSPGVRGWLWSRASEARSPLEFAHALSYRRQGTSDDLTAVVARLAQKG